MLVREDRERFQTEENEPSQMPSMFLLEGGRAIRGLNEKLAAHPVASIGSMTEHNRGTSPNFRKDFLVKGKNQWLFQLRY
jgi:hypothetical protein